MRMMRHRRWITIVDRVDKAQADREFAAGNVMKLASFWGDLLER
jgi:hypothetical protein